MKKCVNCKQEYIEGTYTCLHCGTLQSSICISAPTGSGKGSLAHLKSDPSQLIAAFEEEMDVVTGAVQDSSDYRVNLASGAVNNTANTP